MEADTPSQDQPTLELQEIREIVDLMAENNLSYFHLTRGSCKIELRRGTDVEAVKDLLSKLPMGGTAMINTAPPSTVSPPPSSGGSSGESEKKTTTVHVGDGDFHGPTINSPMVGTFYRSSGPGEKSFANVGDTVDENTVVCIIEAMKVMNEIKAEARGTIVRVLADDAKPVQYGQPLFELK